MLHKIVEMASLYIYVVPRSLVSSLYLSLPLSLSLYVHSFHAYNFLLSELL